MQQNIIGQRFGKLIVIAQAMDYISPSGGVHLRYLCMCDCGNTKTILKEHLVSGRQKSCGCLKKHNGKVTHGDTHSRLYRIWGNMCNRCLNEHNPAWVNYGARGITVCPGWRSYENFREWALSSGYADRLTIDRIDNNLGYCPDNCRWADDVTQANNKRNNHYITYQGKTASLASWAIELGIPYKTLHNRVVSLGWTVERAFTQPLRNRQRAMLPNN